MNTQQAERIINEYGKVVEKISTAGFTSAAPDVLLPYPKNEIKEAIKIGMQFATQNEKMRESLKTVYVMLAQFVSTEESRICNTVQDLIVSKNTKNIPDNYLERNSEIQKRIAEEMKLLGEELEKYNSR